MIWVWPYPGHQGNSVYDWRNAIAPPAPPEPEAPQSLPGGGDSDRRRWQEIQDDAERRARQRKRKKKERLALKRAAQAAAAAIKIAQERQAHWAQVDRMMTALEAAIGEQTIARANEAIRIAQEIEEEEEEDEMILLLLL